ncbi:hypothetical protein D1007_15095 [Hordeum vulgare]|nr:hypothetical protein D1007_15095 [Hordeum vulgare]
MLNPRWGDGRIVRVRVTLNVNEPLMRFVSITKNQRKVYYSILYEKMPVFCYVCGHMGHTFLEHGNGKHDREAMAWGDWILAARSGGQGTRQQATGGSKVNPQGRTGQGRPLAKELQDDAISPHKVGVGTVYEGEKSRKRLTYEEPTMETSKPKPPLLLEAAVVGTIPMDELDANTTADGEEEDDVSSQDSKRSRTGYSGIGSTRAVLRSNKGVFIAGSCSDIPFAEDASSAKARALRDGLLLASEVGVQQIIVESDCQDVIDTMLLDGNSLDPAAAVYEECSFLAKNFSLIQFAFCPREENIVAHTLARFAEPTRTIKWMEEAPGFLIDTLANDNTMGVFGWLGSSTLHRIEGPGRDYPGGADAKLK